MAYEFWLETVVKRLAPTAVFSGTSLMLPARTKAGVAEKRIGSIAFAYLASAEHTMVSSAIEPVPPHPQLTLIDSQVEGVLRPLVIQLINDWSHFPCVFGILGNADGSSTMTVSQSPDQCFLCEPTFIRPFSLTRVRQLFKVLNAQQFNELRNLLRLIADTQAAETIAQQNRSRIKLMAASEKSPELLKLISQTGLKYGSPDLDILRIAYSVRPVDRDK